MSVVFISSSEAKNKELEVRRSFGETEVRIQMVVRRGSWKVLGRLPRRKIIRLRKRIWKAKPNSF